MNPNEQLLQLLITWGNAIGPAKDAAFNALVTWMANNPGLAQNIIKGGAGALTAAYEVHLLRIFAAGAGARIAQRRLLPSMTVHLARLAGNFGRVPKVPHPAVNGLIFIGAILLTGCEMKSEVEAYEAAKPSYNMYVIRYISTMAQAKLNHPHANIPSPMEFPEWYEKERT